MKTFETSRRKNLKDMVFGRLTAIAPVVGCRKGKWLCRCDCGNEKLVADWPLIHGKTKSCGCLRVDTNRQLRSRTTHGMWGTRTYKSWMSMKSRCENKSHPRYPGYGGRGIKICDRWSTSFENFLEDMGQIPPGKTLDRVDNEGDYKPENCRWATYREQGANLRKNVWITYRGKTLILQEWARIKGVRQQTLWRRFQIMGVRGDELFAAKVKRTTHPLTKE